MKVFLTGASGFVGSHLLTALIGSQKHEVAVLLRDAKSAWRIQSVLPKVRVIEGELGDTTTYQRELEEFKPDAVAHLAWSGVGAVDRNNLDQWRNISAALELVQASAKAGAKHWVGLGSQAEYGPCQMRVSESAATRPTTLYGAAKLSACELSGRWCNQMGLRHAWLRLFSSFGPGDNSDWLIPYVIRHLLSGKSPSLTRAEQLWDYIYVADAAEAVLSVITEPNAVGVFNLGSGVARPLRTTIETIAKQMNSKIPLGFGEVPYRPDQVMHLEADIHKLREVAGWYPKYGFDEAIDKTIAWYVENPI
jgi:UDP-glucose 4-epimerase